MISDLRPSPEPAVVLSSLARVCVPSFSDGCTVELSEGTDPVFRIAYPLPGDEPGGKRAAALAERIVTTPLQMPSCYGRPAFAGLVRHDWRLRAPAPSDTVIARLLVEAALALVRRARVEDMAAAADERSAQLALEVLTSATIGEATGIVMATRGLHRAKAFDLLRQTASGTGHAVHDVAAAVVRAGGLEYPADLPPGQPQAGRSAAIHTLPRRP